jgi:hypothetical protein
MQQDLRKILLSLLPASVMITKYIGRPFGVSLKYLNQFQAPYKKSMPHAALTALVAFLKVSQCKNYKPCSQRKKHLHKSILSNVPRGTSILPAKINH